MTTMCSAAVPSQYLYVNDYKPKLQIAVLLFHHNTNI